jgi:hypothetical protein
MTTNMKSLSIFALLLFLSHQLYGQSISGKVLGASNDQPLIYASIGVIETTFGTITNEEGNFNLDVKGQPISSRVRFSMIGFKSQTYTIEELSNKENILRLENETFKLPEVIVKPFGKLRKVGTTSYSRLGFCGWGGDQFGKGWEIGTLIELGELPVRLKSLHIHVNKQSYDSSLFRLHIRDIVDSLPQNELLNKDILISLTKESGWIEIDLSKYNLVFEGDIALSLEWIKVIGVNMDRLITVNLQKQALPAVTFDKKRNQGFLYSKWGTEAKWLRHADSPSIYLSVQ